jgi:Rrf2 family protein
MLTQKGKYAIKALVFLAEKGNQVKTQEIADAAHIPKKFLEAILIELKNHGLVGSKQGASGGYFLAKKPTEISLADLHRIFEGPIALLQCAAIKFYKPCEDCDDVNSCHLRQAMVEVRNQTLKSLECLTIQKIADGKGCEG